MLGVHLGPILKKNYFMGFFIPKIVEFGILCIVITCLVPKLSFFMFFKMGIGGHFGSRGQDVSKSKQ